MKKCRLFHVEQFIPKFILILPILAFFLAGCHREDPSPELRDPIYQDLLHDLQGKTQARDDAQKKINSLEIALKHDPPRSIDRSNDKMALKREQNLYQKLVQDVAYAKIRTDRRKVEGRRAYRIAFLEGKPWPSPKEYQQYLRSKHLASVAKDWTRPPKHH